MIELDVQVLSARREGLLVELGRLVVAQGYSLLRQRLTQDARGACLSMRVRGPAERQLLLEDALATHARVLSFESARAGEAASHAPLPDTLSTASLPAAAPATSAPMVADVRQVESVLPQLAHDYPHVFPWLASLQDKVADGAREASLHLAGRRTGTWVYKRDFAFGAKLPLGDAIKRIAMPALRALTVVDQHGEQLHIRNSALCTPHGASGCRFFGGYLEGLLGEATGSGAVFVRHLHCRSTGAADCVLDISP